VVRVHDARLGPDESVLVPAAVRPVELTVLVDVDVRLGRVALAVVVLVDVRLPMSMYGSPASRVPLPFRSTNPSSPRAVTMTVASPSRGLCRRSPQALTYMRLYSPANGATSTGSLPPVTRTKFETAPRPVWLAGVFVGS
jgi:hypothetical protein